MAKSYEVQVVGEVPGNGDWESDEWGEVIPLAIDEFRPESSDHRPVTEVKVLHDGRNVGVFFRVKDAYVRAAPREFQGPVCRDSCVEFFVRPHQGRGYFNFEINCGGVLHASYIEDWTRVGDGFGKRTMLTAQQVEPIEIRASLPRVVDPERPEPTTWTVDVCLPIAVMESFLGPIGELGGECWAVNLYKCGDDTSHPHWASWSPVSELNFHCPSHFGKFRFK